MPNSITDFAPDFEINETSISSCSSISESKDQDLDYEVYYIWRFKERRKNITTVTWRQNSQFLSALVIAYISFDNIMNFTSAMCRYGILYYVPYFIFNLLVICPLLMLDMTIGSVSNYGPGKCFEIIPIFIGLGWSMMCAAVIFNSSYFVILDCIVLCLYYGLKMDMPFWRCNNDFNSPNCTTRFINGSIQNTSFSTYEFWKQVLKLEYDIERYLFFDQIDPVKLFFLIIIMLITSILLFVEKHVISFIFRIFISFSMIFCIFMMIYIFNFDGSLNGLRLLVKFDYRNIFKLSMWFDAIYVSFSSKLIGYGIILTYASYNTVPNDVHRDSILIVLYENTFSTLTAIVYSILNSIGSYNLNVPITCPKSNEYISIFMQMLMSFKAMSYGKLLISLFLITNFSITYPTYFAFLKSTYVATAELLDISRRTKRGKILKFCVILFYFLISLFYTQMNSIVLFKLFHLDILQILIPILALMEILIFSFFYGIRNLHSALLTVRQFSWMWIYIIGVIAPICISAVLLTCLLQEHDQAFLPFHQVVSFFTILLVLSPIGFGIIVQFIRYRREYVTLPIKKVFKKMLIVKDYWVAEKRFVKRWKK